jgi:hypothetical protein
VAEAFVPLAMPDWIETGQSVDAWNAISRP